MSIMDHSHKFKFENAGQQRRGAGDKSIHFWALNKETWELNVHANLSSAAQAAGAGGVTFAIGASRAATPEFLRFVGDLANVLERDNSVEARIERAELVTRWNHSTDAKKKAWAKDEGIDVEQLKRRVQRAQAMQQKVMISGVEFAYSFDGHPVVRLHHGYWRGKYDDLSKVFNYIKDVYAGKAPPPTSPTSTPDASAPAPAADAPAADAPAPADMPAF